MTKSSWIETSLPLLALLIACVALSEWLGHLRGGRHLGPAVIVIVLGALLSNCGIVPQVADGIAVYDGIFAIVLPLSIFYLLLDANLVQIRRSAGSLLGLFLLGSLGTVLGVVAALQLTPLRTLLPGESAALAGMFAATYIGGGANFNAVALAFGVTGEPAVYGAAVAVDNVMSALWVVLTIALPGLLRRTGRYRTVAGDGVVAATVRATHTGADQAGVPSPARQSASLALLLAVGVVALLVSNAVSALLLDHAGVRAPSVLILTTLALLVAQTPFASRLRAGQALGMFGILLFLGVVGASANLSALVSLGHVAVVMFAFVTIVLLVHAAVLFGGGLWLRRDPDLIALASTANIGGSSTALALAESIGRPGLAVGGVLVGSLGNALGTYVGFALAAWLS